MLSEPVRKRLAEFYASLDLACELPDRFTAIGLTPFLLKQFGSEEEFWRLTEKLRELKARAKDVDTLASQLAALIKGEPRYFLILMHLHRQIRFTNLELVHLLFNADQLNNHSYYIELMKQDPVFSEAAKRQQSSRDWVSYVGPMEYGTPGPSSMASFKKVVASYVGDEGSCWRKWQSRILRDPSVPLRIARFLVKNEDFDHLVKEDSIISALKRSLRTVNVEIVKRERGEYGARRVSEILKAAGLVHDPYRDAKTLEDLEQQLRQSTLIQAQGQFVYTTEKRWAAEDKRFDFVLTSQRKAQFVIETNYFTTSMSKIREVVKHYKDLRQACLRKGYRLLYVTDGIGWLSLAKTLAEMIALDDSIGVPGKVPFLMNLAMLQNWIEKIKQQMI
jgi:hypothetical protein